MQTQGNDQGDGGFDDDEPVENEALNFLEYMGILGPLALIYIITLLYLL